MENEHSAQSLGVQVGQVYFKAQELSSCSSQETETWVLQLFGHIHGLGHP